MTSCTVTDFFQYEGPCLDVRSPLEYEHAHIPGAISFPLFSNDERHQIGVVYKQKGQQKAIDLGIQLIAPKLPEMVKKIRTLEVDKTVRVYCARGGMRSQFVSYLISFMEYQVVTLHGGYKTYRQYVLHTLQTKIPKKLILLSGLTGAGKSELLVSLKQINEQVLDLEAYASHRGSVFGEQKEQRISSEFFENIIAQKVDQIDQNQIVWIEDESRLIGNCLIPEALYIEMRRAPSIFFDVSFEERIDRIVKEYSILPKTYLIEATKKLEKRLGREKMREVSAHILQDQFSKAAAILLQYYDQTYLYAKRKKTGAQYICKKAVYKDTNELIKAIQGIKEKIESFYERTALTCAC